MNMPMHMFLISWATRLPKPGAGNDFPFAHIDPLGFIMLLLFRFGYGKPVMINQTTIKTGVKERS